MAEVIFDPPVTIEECRLAGRQFGGMQAGSNRVIFEQALVGRLAALSDALILDEHDRDEAIAAFDQAAWMAWEAGAKRLDQPSRELPVSVNRSNVA